MNWYILKAQNMRENKVAESLKDQVSNDKIEECLGEVIVPEEEVIENSINGKKKTIKRRFYPGYVFIKAELTDEFLLSVKKIKFASGFIGGNKPTPVTKNEIKKIKQLVDTGMSNENPVYKITFKAGEEVHINAGPFEGFTGTVNTADYDKNILDVDVLVFGRNTSINLEFGEVSK